MFKKKISDNLMTIFAIKCWHKPGYLAPFVIWLGIVLDTEELDMHAHNPVQWNVF